AASCTAACISSAKSPPPTTIISSLTRHCRLMDLGLSGRSRPRLVADPQRTGERIEPSQVVPNLTGEPEAVPHPLLHGVPAGRAPSTCPVSFAALRIAANPRVVHEIANAHDFGLRQHVELREREQREPDRCERHQAVVSGHPVTVELPVTSALL